MIYSILQLNPLLYWFLILALITSIIRVAFLLGASPVHSTGGIAISLQLRPFVHTIAFRFWNVIIAGRLYASVDRIGAAIDFRTDTLKDTRLSFH